MADDDAAAPDGELTESSAAEEKSGAVEPESAAQEAGRTSDADKTADGEAEETELAEETEPADESDDESDDEGDKKAKKARRPWSHLRVAAIVGVIAVLALGGLTGWLGYRAYGAYQADQNRNLFLQVGRQGALNLTTIDWQHAEADVQRVLDSATGTFYDDFQNRAEPFIAVVKQAQSKSVGTIAEAGLESATENEGKVLVAVTVETTNIGAPEQEPRAWRMRLTVQKVGDEAKVSAVDFVP
jgi:Mce-associated membrane protein